MKNIIIFFFKVLKIINHITKKIFGKEFLLYLKTLIENDSYKKLNILGKTTVFFVPNSLINWRVSTLMIKEPETIKWINEFNNNKKEIIFWDIGSNIGLYSMYAALKHTNLKVVSFEPSTSNLRVLSRNISINKLDKNIAICQLPLGQNSLNFNKMNEINFLEGYSENSFGEAINFEGKKINYNNRYDLLGTSINQLVKDKILEHPNYIKIDVDGLEHLILLGATIVLSDSELKSILVEINENFKKQYDTIFKIMKTYSFVLESKSRSEKFYKGNKNKIYNYIFKKNEKKNNK